MLKKQQAHALIEARELMVKGATSIAYRAIQDFDAYGLKMSSEERAKLCGNIILVTVSESDTVPTVNVVKTVLIGVKPIELKLASVASQNVVLVGAKSIEFELVSVGVKIASSQNVVLVGAKSIELELVSVGVKMACSESN
eukprot:Pgem_evm1s68